MLGTFPVLQRAFLWHPQKAGSGRKSLVVFFFILILLPGLWQSPEEVTSMTTWSSHCNPRAGGCAGLEELSASSLGLGGGWGVPGERPRSVWL